MIGGDEYVMKEYIPWLISAFMALIAYLNYYKSTDEKDRSELDGIKESLLKANMKLDQVCATTNETRTDIKSLDRNLRELEKRVVVLEHSVEELKCEQVN